MRFWPLYIAGLGFGVVRELLLIVTHNHYAFSPSMLLLATVTGAIFLPLPLSQRGGNLFPMNIPSWSLFFELLVNVVYALVRPVLGIGALAVIVVATASAFAMLVPSEGIGGVGVTGASVLGGSVRTILSFSMGLLIHQLHLEVPKVPTPVVLILVALSLVCPWGGVGYDLMFVLLISPLMVLLGTAVEPKGRLAGLATWLGLVSFPLYAIHRPLLEVVEALANRVPLSSALLGWVAVVGLLILANFANRADIMARGRLTSWLHAPLRRDPAERAAP